MSIREILGKIKGYLEIDRVFYALILILLCAASFGLGRLSVVGDVGGPPIQKMTPRTSSQVGSPAAAQYIPEKATSTSVTPSKETSGEGAYVGSKNGTKYHLPWCSGAQRIKEENKVWFTDKESAEKAGYTPAGNCPGI